MSEKKIPLIPNRYKGIALVLTAWAFLTVTVALSRHVGEASSVPVILLFQNGLSFLLISPFVLIKGKKGVQLQKYPLFFIRAIAGYLSFALTFLAVQKISLVNAMLLSNSAPLFIPLIIWIWKRVKITPALWAGICIGFVGIGIILKPSAEIMNIGAAYGIGAAIAFSIAMIAQRRLLKVVPLRTVLFYYFFVCTILSIPLAVETWVPLTKELLFFLIGMGLCFATGQLCFLNALRFEKPSFLSAFNYSAVVYGALIQWLYWDLFPGWRTIIGILVVCSGGILVMFKGKDYLKPQDRSID